MTYKSISIALLTLTIISCSQPDIQNKYLGLAIPDKNPDIFAPGFISVDSTGEALISVTYDGQAIFFPRYFYDEDGDINGVRSLVTTYNGQNWTELKPKDRDNFYRTPQFVSNKLAIMASKGCIWKSNKVNDSVWSKPIFIDSLDLSHQNGVSDWSITNDRLIYYVQNGNIITAKVYDDSVTVLSKIKGFDNFRTRHIGISPDGSYLVCDGYIEDVNTGWVNLFISFKEPNNEWTFPKHMGSEINSLNDGNYFPRISPDGEVFFFTREDSTRQGDIYWMSTKELGKFKNEE